MVVGGCWYTRASLSQITLSRDSGLYTMYHIGIFVRDGHRPQMLQLILGYSSGRVLVGPFARGSKYTNREVLGPEYHTHTRKAKQPFRYSCSLNNHSSCQGPSLKGILVWGTVKGCLGYSGIPEPNGPFTAQVMVLLDLIP